MANVKNYVEQGGEKTVIGGEIEIKGKLKVADGGTVEGVVTPAANVAAVTPAGAEPTALETAVNGILTALKAAGLMVADEAE